MTVSQWKSNPLFRLLAFLDIVGIQRFSILNDISSSGAFVDVNRTFGPPTAVHQILSCGLQAFRSNISHLFADEAERQSMLRLVSDDNDDNNESNSSTTANNNHNANHHNSDDNESDDDISLSSSHFARDILWPSSLQSFLDCFENDLPVLMFVRLREAFGWLGSPDASVSLPEQFLIDALDAWMSGRSDEENDKLVLASSVRPAVLMSARAQSEELPNAVTDFIIDVVFPPHAALREGEEEIIDWIIVSYEKCHEMIDVDDEEAEVKEEMVEVSNSNKRRRTEDTLNGANSAENGLEGDDEEEFLTADNLDQYMIERPSAIPKEILLARRKALTDPSITAFELENHYSASELRNFAKDVLNRKVMRKADCVRAILSHHNTMATLNVTPTSVNTTVKDGSSLAKKEEEEEEEDSSEIKRCLGNPSWSVEELVEHFLLREMKVFITKELHEKAPNSKQQCAELIVAKRKS